ncbi:glutathione S-transferase family protein [Yoonia sp.]|uniref:glutathione S-transferase family protein n=1 Tax=Yoonia sp. TaxID=2212373 RepID=UPI0019DEA307|nr:glutathione S-transferase family protein [Yoonia sp.]MBE0413240.1 glutathione S-transferase family protein [Yoonia sp.]
MTKPLILHYAPDNASFCVRLALEELHLPYRTVLVDRATGGQKSADFLTLNPNGLIPVLETPHGPLFETGAILLWLADRSGILMPPPLDPARGPALQWLIWLANTLHPTQRMLFYPDQYTATAPEALRTRTRTRLTALFDLLESASQADWLDTEAPSAQGCYLGPLLRWPALYGGQTDWFDLRRWPRLMRFAQSYEARPAARRASDAEGLGPQPFSAPLPCHPPEGSAV